MKVLIFPKDSNPYQALLYSSMPESIEIKYLGTSQRSITLHMLYFPILVLSLIFNRIKGYRIIHIHWLYPLAYPKKLPFSKFFSFKITILFFKIIRILKFKIIWTVHNVVPHEDITSNDILIRKKLSVISNAKIIHSKSVLEELKNNHISIKNTYVIPIGSYESFYPHEYTKYQARLKLGIGQSEMVAVFMGRIEPYKGIPNIIEAFRGVYRGTNNEKLIIAGKAKNEEMIKILKTAKREFGDNIILPGYVEDKKVQIYLKAADLAVYPFTNITTSSTVMLALSFGLPIVAPLMGMLKDLPKDVGYFYDFNKKNGFLIALKFAFSDKNGRNTKSKNAKHYSDNLTWDLISKQTYDLYAQTLKD